MKLVFTLICLFVGSFVAHAQTDTQTLEWLNAKSIDIRTAGSDNLGLSDKIKLSFTPELIRVDDDNGGYKRYYWYNIKEIKEDAYGSIQIIFNDNTSTSKSYMNFYYNGNKSSMINALKHLATLKGAKLLDDGMFK